MTREEWLNAAVAELRPLFKQQGHPLPDKVRVTCGFPSQNARGRKCRTIGEHWSPSASADATHEIFISPIEDDPFEVFGVLVHELAHAATDGDGHRGRFPALVRSLWLEGKVTATVIGDAFRTNFQPVIDSLGAYPHAALNVPPKAKVQSTRMLKAHCKVCGYTVRLTKRWADVGLPFCPTCSVRFAQ